MRCRYTSTTSYVPYLRYDVVTYDVHTISSKPTMSHVQTTMSYGIHRMRNRRLKFVESITSYATSHTMFTLFSLPPAGRPGDPNPYCCIVRSPYDCFLHCSVFIAVHSTQFKPAPLLPCRRLGGSRRLSSRHRLSSSSSATGCLTILVVFTLRHCIVMIDRRSALASNSIADCRFPGLVKKGMKISVEAHRRKLARSPADQNYVKHQ
jgi:hypothetical protein